MTVLRVAGLVLVGRHITGPGRVVDAESNAVPHPSVASLAAVAPVTESLRAGWERGTSTTADGTF